MVFHTVKKDIKNARSKTTLDRASALANYFNVSVDYLIGRTDICNFNITTPTTPILSEEQRKKNSGIYKKSV